jgi:hypothetical protein
MFVAYASSLFTRFSVRQFGATSAVLDAGGDNLRTMVRALRVGAVICLFFALLSGVMTLSLSAFTRGGGVVIRKYIEGTGSATQFRLVCKLDSGGEYDCPYSHRFYDVAKVGDHLQFPFEGYTRLVRNGKTIKRDFSGEIVPVVYSLIAIAPSIVFVRADRLPFRRSIYIFVGLLEVLLIGLTLFSMFMPA